MSQPLRATALRNTCVLETPSPLIDAAFQYAKDNIARTMRWYTLGWGMSNCPHASTIVVGRDTGWMCLGTDYVAPWFAPEALRVFRDRQKPNGQILEYIDLESGAASDYGLNIADNTPLYIWAVWRHWTHYADEAFRAEFLPSVRAAGEHLIREIGPSGLLVGIPVGTATEGTTSWRNIIEGYVLAGEVTEINALSSMALRMIADFTGDDRFADGAQRIADAVDAHLWQGDGYLLTRYLGEPNAQATGDALFPIICGLASPEQARRTLARLAQPDFWTVRGLRTVPITDAMYDPAGKCGLVGGSWPNLTLWYAAAVAPFDPDAALAALEIVARPVVEEQPEDVNVRHTEFAEYFHGETGANLGMHLSPWVAPTFVWALLEGLLGLRWHAGEPQFSPHWPAGWHSVRLQRLPTSTDPLDVTLERP